MSTVLRDEYHALLEAAAAAEADFNEERSLLERIPWETAAIGENDTLLVVDMQIDFLPGGAFGVDEGDAIIDGVCETIQKFHKAGATVIATRDYHPIDHVSFLSHGGPFPPHCVQGTEGSFFHPKIKETLQPLLATGDDGTKKKKTHVVYKAFSRDVDSFGGFMYADDESWKERISHSPACNHCVLEWTGAYHLFASNLHADANAPPDVMSVLEKKSTTDLLPSKEGRIFCCGLAYDFCVIDSAVNYRKAVPENGKYYILQDLTRAARIPGIGSFGSGFLTDPRVHVKKLADHGIQLVRLE